MLDMRTDVTSAHIGDDNDNDLETMRKHSVASCNDSNSHNTQNKTLRSFAFDNMESFWAKQSRGIDWFNSFEKTLEWNLPFAKWFVGGMTNACFNAVDRHQAKHSQKPAILWEAEDGARRTITYGDLYADTQRFANVLKSMGVKSGDRVTIYLPMVPELVVAMLSCARIGAMHTVIFSGFSAASIKDRVLDSGSKVIITADGGYRRGKIIELKSIVDDAISDLDAVQHVVVLRRTNHKISMSTPRDEYWDDLMNSVSHTCKALPLESSHPLFILYTSGTTGKPKGVLHGTGGYLTHVHATFRWAFGNSNDDNCHNNFDPDDVYFCTADVGWVTGHSYVVYAPLLHGITSVMYEGAPDYPNHLRMWNVIHDYKITIFYTTPTLLRMLIRFEKNTLKIDHNKTDNPNYDYATNTKSHFFDTLRLLGTVGEPINPKVWKWYHKQVGQERCPIVDTWWQTETGGMLISPLPGLEKNIALKPGSATRPIPGIEVDVLDDDGNSVPANTRGHLVIRKPWPGMLMSLWHDDSRYTDAYWTRYPGMYNSGDYARIDKDGYVWILGRADDVLKIAGHRIGTAEIEGCIVSHKNVAESAVCGVPDEVKGEAIVVFAVPKADNTMDDEQLASELIQKIRDEIGAIATPGAIHVVSRLPKTRSGKIMRRLLRSLVLDIEMGDASTVEDADVVSEIRNTLSQSHKTNV